MYSEWIDKRFIFKERLKHNTAIIILAVIDIVVGLIFMLLPSENNSGEGSVNSFGYIFIFLGIGLIIICIATLILFSANRTISKLKKAGFTQQDLYLFDSEMQNYKNKPLSISFADIYITRSFFVKNFTKANKVQIFKMTNVDKVVFENSNAESNPGRLYSANIKTGVISFYDATGNKLFALSELRDDAIKIFEYIRASDYKTYIGN